MKVQQSKFLSSNLTKHNVWSLTVFGGLFAIVKTCEYSCKKATEGHGTCSTFYDKNIASQQNCNKLILTVQLILFHSTEYKSLYAEETGKE